MGQCVCQKQPHRPLVAFEKWGVLHGSIFVSKKPTFTLAIFTILLLRQTKLWQGCVLRMSVFTHCLEALRQAPGSTAEGERRLLPPHGTSRERVEPARITCLHPAVCVVGRNKSIKSKQFMRLFCLY